MTVTKWILKCSDLLVKRLRAGIKKALKIIIMKTEIKPENKNNLFRYQLHNVNLKILTTMAREPVPPDAVEQRKVSDLVLTYAGSSLTSRRLSASRRKPSLT